MFFDAGGGGQRLLGELTEAMAATSVAAKAIARDACARRMRLRSPRIPSSPSKHKLEAQLKCSRAIGLASDDAET